MGTESKNRIYFAPLQGITDFVYRSAFANTFGNTDKYYAPYILRQNDGTIKKAHIRDISLENNSDYQLVPQVMAGNTKDFLYLSKTLCDSGYKEINWNLGCPYPMLTNKELGAGLLPSPEKIKRILTESLPKVSCRISVKMRSGLASADEMFNVIPILNQFPLSEVIIHPRIAKQLYVGCADPEVFIRAATISRHPLIYNGDILTIDDFNKLDALFESTSSWMIGRGILKDPFLPAKIKLLTLPDKKEKSQLMAQFHDQIFSSYSKMLSGKSHLLMRMTNFWSYFCFSFPEPAKVFKRIKKAGTTTKYEEALKENFKRLNHNEED